MMHTRSPRASWLPIIALVFAANAGAQDAPSSYAALEDSIQVLRAQARYTEARVLADSLVAAVTQSETAKPYEIIYARYVVASLMTVAGLTRQDQAAFAEADSLGSVVSDLYGQARYGEAATFAERQLDIYERLMGPGDPDVAESLNNLAALYGARGQYARAEPLYKRALEIREKALGPDNPEVAMSLNDLAELYRAQGQYAQAEPPCRRALEIRENAFGPDDPHVALSLNNLAALYYTQGSYAQAEPMYKRARAIYEKTLGPDHPAVATSLNNLATLYSSQRQYAQAEPLYKRSLEIREKDRGPDHPDVATALNNLALLYNEQGQYARAEPMHKRALEIREKAFGPDHSVVATSLNNLATLYDSQGQYAQAEPLYKRSLEIREKALGPDHPDVTAPLNNLALLYYTHGQYAQAEPMYQRVLEIREKALGPNHPSAIYGLRNLAGLYLSTGRPDSAATMLADAAHRFEFARLRVGRGLDRATFQTSPYPALAIASLSSGAVEQAWPATEKACGRALMELLVSARQRPWTAAESAREDSLARAVKALEPRLAALIKAAHADSSAEAGERVQTTRLDLLTADAQWSEFAQAMAQKYPIAEGQSYPLDRVQAVLNGTQAIAGWLDFKLKKDEYVSWAYVLRHQGPVTWVQLPGAAAADTTSPFDRARACGEALRSAQDADATVAAFSTARIQPLLPALAGIEDLIVIPTGAMATIPIEALMDDQGRRLGDRFTISYAPSATIYTWLREARLKDAPPIDRQIASGKALLLGDPPFTPKQRDMMLYEVPAIATEAAEDEAAVEVATLRGAVVGDEVALAELPRLRNSRREVQAIEDLSGGPTVLLGPAASEQAIVKLAESGDLAGYRTIHLATHALVDQERPERSCLILSRVDLPDAYEAAKRGERIYDGRLTVQEILQEWKLNADLVTLSACETGLGQDIRGEGLVGFAHAFLQAGARSLLVSLWKVDDRATSLIMTRFYRNLWERQLGKAAALREAKEWLRGYEDKFGKRPYGSPYYWSAFILIGDRG